MVISHKNKYIFIANPKTATTSIQRFLLQKDESAKNYYIKINDVEYSFGEHDTAAQIKRELGDIYDDFTVFGFIRNPYDKMVSGYHFMKNGKPITDGHKGSKWPIRLKVLAAKVLPFKIRSLIHPFKSNKEYFTDAEGKIIVDRIGLFENLHHDLKKILEEINVPFDCSDLPIENRSSHKKYESYYGEGILDKLLEKKMSFDIEFYESIKNKNSSS